MLKVTIATEGKKLSLRLEGHAGYAEVGKDIVCASASILAYTVAQIVDIKAHGGCLKEPAVIRLKSGDTEVACVPKDGAYDALWDAYDFARLGYFLLAHNYPQYVELITDGKAE